MKKVKIIGIVIGILIIVLIIKNIFFLYSSASKSVFKEDTFLSQVTNKNALIIVAHDDDAISMAGTISALCENGWNVSEICFYQGWQNKDSLRKIDLEKVAKIQGLKGVEYHDVEIRRNFKNVQKPYMPLPYNTFDSAFNKDTALTLIEEFINRNNPSVIFTLDDLMGGYGHPEHVLISKLVLDFCKEHKADSLLKVERIYQAVFPIDMRQNILGGNETYESAKKIYKITPNPDVYVSISGQEKIKKEILQTYTTEQNALTKVWPYYNYYPAKFYFKIFDKEYYRVLVRSDGYR